MRFEDAPLLKVAIIGGGATGVMAALHLLKKFSKEIQISIFDPASELGRGLAYSARESQYLLNVPMSNMSVFSSEPMDFQNWCGHQNEKKEIPEIFKYDPFVPRFLFGNYLEERFDQAQKINLNKVTWIRSRISSLEMLNLEYGEFDHVLVATGFKNQLQIPRGLEGIPSDVCFSSPFAEGSYQNLRGTETILIVGTGLTAIDIYRKLKSRGHSGNILFLSRRGLWPLVHPELSGPVSKSPELEFLIEKGRVSPREFLFKFRKLAREGNSYPDLVTQIRSRIPSIWQSWSSFHKNQFLRHLKPYWEVIRHRVPGRVFSELLSDLESGKCQNLRGRIVSAERTDSKIQVLVRTPSEHKMIQVNRIYLATGHALNDSIDRSFEHNTDDKVVFLGPASKQENWEITAVPDIRNQIEKWIDNLGMPVEKSEILVL